MYNPAIDWLKSPQKVHYTGRPISHFIANRNDFYKGYDENF